MDGGHANAISLVIAFNRRIVKVDEAMKEDERKKNNEDGEKSPLVPTSKNTISI